MLLSEISPQTILQILKSHQSSEGWELSLDTGKKRLKFSHSPDGVAFELKHDDKFFSGTLHSGVEKELQFLTSWLKK